MLLNKINQPKKLGEPSLVQDRWQRLLLTLLLLLLLLLILLLLLLPTYNIKNAVSFDVSLTATIKLGQYQDVWLFGNTRYYNLGYGVM